MFGGIWEMYCDGGCRYPCVGNFLSGVGTICYSGRLIILVHDGGDDNNAGGEPYKLPNAYYR